MPIFISYSHQDSEFASELASQLVKHKARVWIDQWEIHVGDSLIDRIQTAIQGASALLVILSKAFVESEWCKKELNSGLIRELEEKRVIVLPVLIENCDIPVFLREKMYADFRTDFDKGLNDVLEAIARITSANLGRHEAPKWHIDWSIDHGFSNGNLLIRITIVKQAIDQPYSSLTEIVISGNDIATERGLKFLEAEIFWLYETSKILILAEVLEKNDYRMLLEDQNPKMKEFEFTDSKSGGIDFFLITSRRLGEDTGRDILLNLAGQVKNILETRKQALRPPTQEELDKMSQIHEMFSKSNQ